MGKKKRQPGRPRELTMPEPIPDTPENVARALLNTPPKRREEWDYLREREQEIKERRA